MNSAYQEALANHIRNGARNLVKPVPGGGVEDDPTNVARLAHNRSEFAINETAQPWPSLSDLKKKANPKWDIGSLKERLAELKEHHKREIEKAVQYRSHEEQKVIQDYYDMASDIRMPHRKGSAADMKAQEQKDMRLARFETDDIIQQLRDSYILAITPLQEKLKELQKGEEEQKLERAKTFPVTPQAWRDMDTRDAKLKVAQFLVMSRKDQEDTLRRESNWKRKPLEFVLQQFQTDTVFAKEVRDFIKQNQTTDPRRRVG
ncbi:hypothetical protein M422DRAFT_23844 [Sphaerobolus stellatus SS14]|nr:hypothetical protein M422DRAFT_23844 [Sphaerobolus stellatus SS14]